MASLSESHKDSKIISAISDFRLDGTAWSESKTRQRHRARKRQGDWFPKFHSFPPLFFTATAIHNLHPTSRCTFLMLIYVIPPRLTLLNIEDSSILLFVQLGLADVTNGPSAKVHRKLEIQPTCSSRRRRKLPRRSKLAPYPGLDRRHGFRG